MFRRGYSVPCPKGACYSPLEVVASYGYAKQMMPEDWTKAMLYPATLMLNAEVLMGDDAQSFRFPSWDSILPRWNLTADVRDEERATGSTSLRLVPNFLSMFEKDNPNSLGWEFVGACVVCLLGAVSSVVGPNKISFWGVILIVWFIFLEGGRRGDVYAQPMFAMVVICSCAWVNFKELFSLPREEASPDAAAAQPKVESKKE